MPWGIEARYVAEPEQRQTLTAAASGRSDSARPEEGQPVAEGDAFAFDFAAVPSEKQRASFDDASTSTNTGRQKKRKRRRGGVGPVLAMLAGVAVLAGGWYALGPAGRPEEPAGPAAATTVPDVPVVAERPKGRPAIASPTRGGPVSAVMMPIGVSVVVHVRPAELWSDRSDLAELRACVPPSFVAWAENTIRQRCRLEPAEVEEVTFGLLLGARGVESRVTAVVRTVAPQPLGPLLQSFPGEIRRLGGEARLVRGATEAMLIRDDRTYAVAPVGLGDELAEALSRPAEVATDIVNLLPATDAQRLVTVVASRNDLDIHGPELLGSDAAGLVGSLLGMAGDDAQSFAWSAHFGEAAYAELVVEPSRTTTLNGYEQAFRKRWAALPGSLMDSLRRSRPVGRSRAFAGRVPVMAEAARRASAIDVGAGRLRLSTLLPPKAGPNLALATVVTYNVLHSDVPRTSSRGTTGPVVRTSVAESLATKIEGEFTRTPLQEALAYVAEETGLTVRINGDALKDAGYTQNMAQNFDLGLVPAREALGKIIAQYDQMAVVADEATHTLTVTTLKFAERDGKTPLVFTP